LYSTDNLIPTGCFAIIAGWIHDEEVRREPGLARWEASVRSFVAVEIEPEAQRALAQVADRLRRHLPAGSVRWVDPANIHLTLKFLGEIDNGDLLPIQQVLGPISAQAQPAIMTLTGVGAFPRPQRARVIWIGLDEPQDRLAQLQTAVEAGLAKLGFDRQARKFAPHLTLGRVRPELGVSDRQALAEVLTRERADNLAVSSMRSLVLFRSDLRPSGAVYSPIERFELGTGNHA
jgi:2'-5' RNA ligase